MMALFMRNLLVGLFIIFISLACNKVTDFADFKNPVVSSTYPVNNQEGVPNNAVITINFSESMDQSSVMNNLTFIENQVQGSIGVQFTPVWSGRRQLILKPDYPLITGVRYRITIGDQAKDQADNKLAVPFILMFTVNPDNIQPVANIYIQDYVDASVMGYSYVPLINKKPVMKIYFSEPMDRNKTVSALNVEGINPSYQWLDSSGNPSLTPGTDVTLAIILIDELTLRSKVSLTLGTKAVDLAGNSLKEEKRISFWVGNDFNMPVIQSITVQRTGLTVTVPILDNTGVQNDIDSRSFIKIQFSRPMDAVSVKNAVSISPSKDLFLSWSGNVLTITLPENVSYDFKTTYTIKITTEAKDLEGNPLLEEVKRSFIIGSDLIPPKLESLCVPVIGDLLTLSSTAKNLPLYPEFNLKFSKKMSTETLKNAVVFDPVIDSSDLTVSTVDNVNYNVKVNKKLEFGKLYKITVNNNAGDFDSGGLNKLDKIYSVFFYAGDPLNYIKVGNISVGCDTGFSWPEKVCLKPQIIVSFVYENGSLPHPNLKADSLVDSIQISGISLKNEDILSLGGNEILIELSDPAQIPLSPNTRYYMSILKKIYAADSFETPLKNEVSFSFLTGSEEKFGIKQMSLTGKSGLTQSYWDWDGTTGTKKVYDLIGFLEADNASVEGEYKLSVSLEFLQNFNPQSINSSTFSITQLSGYSASDPYLYFSLSSFPVPVINLEIRGIKITPTRTDDESIYLKFMIQGKESGIKSTQGVPLPQSEEFILKVILPK